MKSGPFFECRVCGKREYAAHDWELGDALYIRLKKEGWTFENGERDCRCPACVGKEQT